MSNHTKNTPIPMERLSAPAQRALTGAGYTTLEQLTQVREAEIAKLHGLGPKTIKLLHEALEAQGLSFAAKYNLIFMVRQSS